MVRRIKRSIKSRPSVEYIPFNHLQGQSYAVGGPPSAIIGLQAEPTGSDFPQDSFIVGGYFWFLVASEDAEECSFIYALVHKKIGETGPSDLTDNDEMERLRNQGTLRRFGWFGCDPKPNTYTGVCGPWGAVVYLKLPRMKLSEDERIQLYIQSLTARVNDVTLVDGGKILYKKM